MSKLPIGVNRSVLTWFTLLLAATLSTCGGAGPLYALDGSDGIDMLNAFSFNNQVLRGSTKVGG